MGRPICASAGLASGGRARGNRWVTLRPEFGCARRKRSYRRPMNAIVKMEYDVYRQKTDPTLRIAVSSGARLPAKFKTKDWTLMARGESPVHSDAARDVGVEGYCYFQVAKG